MNAQANYLGRFGVILGWHLFQWLANFNMDFAFTVDPRIHFCFLGMNAQAMLRGRFGAIFGWHMV